MVSTNSLEITTMPEMKKTESFDEMKTRILGLEERLNAYEKQERLTNDGTPEFRRKLARIAHLKGENRKMVRIIRHHEKIMKQKDEKIRQLKREIERKKETKLVIEKLKGLMVTPKTVTTPTVIPIKKRFQDPMQFLDLKTDTLEQNIAKLESRIDAIAVLCAAVETLGAVARRQNLVPMK